MPSWVRDSLLVSLAVMTVAAVVWAVNDRQRESVEHSFQQSAAVGRMLTGMLDQETSLRGYMQTRERTFLEPYDLGRRLFTTELARLRRTSSDLGAPTLKLVDRTERLARAWNVRADAAVSDVRVTPGYRVPLSEALARKRIMDELRAINATLDRRVQAVRRATARDSQRLAGLLIVALAAGFGLVGWLFLGRPAAAERAARRRENARRDQQVEFARTMQVMDGEREAHELVRRHLERTLGPASVVVLQRNNSADRLEATTSLDGMPALADALLDAEPRSCLAVRLGAQHVESDAALLQCELCGKTGSERALCTPLVVSGEVIGSVLVAHDDTIGPDCETVIEDTVTQAAPVLANMRNLALAEERASTDALTGLANRRAVQDTVHRMVAQAARANAPLAVLAIDIDHFKRINDRLGHDRGDEALTAVAQTLSGALRASDFVGRQGGEEFVALLPDTDLGGAITAAESLRAAVEAIELLGPGAITASFGVAVMPEDGGDGAALLRQADRALYAAKANGRNRVETAASGVSSPLAADVRG
jgi:diguanylate cyclase (GGDEF)-like protein